MDIIKAVAQSGLRLGHVRGMTVRGDQKWNWKEMVEGEEGKVLVGNGGKALFWTT